MKTQRLIRFYGKLIKLNPEKLSAEKNRRACRALLAVKNALYTRGLWVE